MQRLPFESVAGNAYAYAEETTLPGAAFRAVNAAYTESTGVITKQTESLVIMGGDADVDRFIIQTRPGEIANVRAEQTRMKAKAVRMTFHDAFVNGDTGSNANAFDGLDVRLAGGSNEVDAATNGLPIVGADDSARHAFLDKVDEAMALVDGGPDVILVNDLTLAKFRSAARRLTIYDETRDEYGNQVSTYNGVPLVDMGFQTDGSTRVLPQTETQGSSSIASSWYFVKFGRVPADGGVTGLTNGLVQVYDLGEIDDKPVYRTRIEFYCAIAVHGGGAASVLRGVLAS